MRSLLASLLLLLALPAPAQALGPGDVDARFGTDGSVFTRLGPLAEPGTSVAGARDVATASGAGLLVAGSAPDADGDRALAVARYKPSGRPERGFGENGVVVDQLGVGDAPSSAGTAILAEPDGGAIVAGNATAPNGRTIFVVVRYDSEGDATWTLKQPLDESVNAAALELARDAFGRLLVVGRSGDEPFVARIDAVSGAPDVSFAGTGYLVDPIDRADDPSGCTLGGAPATAVLGASDGSVIVGGTLERTCSGAAGSTAFLRRYDTAGVRDPAPPTTGYGLDRITALAAAPFSTGFVASGSMREEGEAVPAIVRVVGNFVDTDFPGPTGFGPLPGFREQPGSAAAVVAAAGDLLVAIDIDDPERPDRIIRTDAGGQRDPSFATTGLARAALRSPRAIAVQADGRVVVVGDHPPASAREAQGFAVVRLFGGTAVSNVGLRSRAPLRRGALRLKLSCSAGPGCAGVVRGRHVGTTDYAIRGGGSAKVDVPVLERKRRRAAFDVKVTNPPAATRSLTIAVSR